MTAVMCNDAHFALDPEYWSRIIPDMAFPPYWFLGTESRKDILESQAGAQRNVGIHVPV